MPGFVLPVAGPYTATTYPLVERYDGDDPLPASWRLKVAFERPHATRASPCGPSAPGA